MIDLLVLPHLILVCSADQLQDCFGIEELSILDTRRARLFAKIKETEVDRWKLTVVADMSPCRTI